MKFYGVYVGAGQTSMPDTTIHGTISFYQEGNAVYQYGGLPQYPNHYYSAGKIYDFDSNVGDTLDYFKFGGEGSIHKIFVLDSIGELEIENQSLGFQDIKAIDTLENSEFTFRVIEKVGAILGFFITDLTIFAPVHHGSTYLFRCYKDETMTVNYSLFGHECDHIPEVVTTVDNATFASLEIFPNPTTDNIRVELSPSKIIQLKVFSIAGQQLLSQNTDNELTVNIDLSTVNQGFYYLVGYDEVGNILSINKVIKN